MPLLRPLLLATTLGLAACASPERPAPPDPDYSAPSEHTRARHRQLLAQLPPENTQDDADARRGLIASPDNLVVRGTDGRVIWDMRAYHFIEGSAPASVHPGLWRQERLNNIHGLFRISQRVYQLRGFDLANMTLIEGESGWIVVDPLTSTETARAALDFARRHLGDKPVKAILFTHSHIDHFGGALGVADAEQVRREGIEVIAPAGFLEEASRENVIAGVAMARRSAMMYGSHLPRSPHGQVGSGLGKAPALGSIGMLAPTRSIAADTERLTLDGVDFVFRGVPGAEAPAEFIFYLPGEKVAMGAELVSRSMHNLYSLRGAAIRDAVLWSEYIDRAMELFADAEVLANGHHWPLWGQAQIYEFLAGQRDLYRYLHDQSVRLLNRGLTGPEIAEQLQLPAALAQNWSNRGYYGSVKHNARAVYQQYMGWFDANPAHLDPLPPVQAARGYVELAGGEDALLKRGREAYSAGNYRWAAELLNHLVFANPGQREARQWLARTYDQLGYQAESAAWRNFYLGAARELRHGTPGPSVDPAALANLLQHTQLEELFNALAVRLDAGRAGTTRLQLRLHFSDSDGHYLLSLANGVLHHRLLPGDGAAPVSDAHLRLTRTDLNRLLSGKVTPADLRRSGSLQLQGDERALQTLLQLLDRPDGHFPLVTP